jgi:hypothetical protein
MAEVLAEARGALRAVGSSAEDAGRLADRFPDFIRRYGEEAAVRKFAEAALEERTASRRVALGSPAAFVQDDRLPLVAFAAGDPAMAFAEPELVPGSPFEIDRQSAELDRAARQLQQDAAARGQRMEYADAARRVWR